MFDYRRTLWQDPTKPVTGPAITWSKIDTVVIHYTGTPNPPEGDDVNVYARYLRNMQASYLTSRGYSLGYSVSVSTHGESWEIRGVDIKPAATKGHNDHTWAILLTVDGDDRASDAAIRKVRHLIGEAQKRAKRSLTIVGHGQFGATACPGAGVRAQIAAGVFAPIPDPPSPPLPPDPPEPPVTDLSAATLWRHNDFLNVFLIGAGAAVNVSPRVYDSLVARGVPVIIEAHHQLLKSCLHQSGLDLSDLVPVKQS